MHLEPIETYEAMAARLARHLEKKYGLKLNRDQGLNAIAIAVLEQRDWHHVQPLLKAPADTQSSEPLPQAKPPGSRQCYWACPEPYQSLYYVLQISEGAALSRAHPVSGFGDLAYSTGYDTFIKAQAVAQQMNDSEQLTPQRVEDLVVSAFMAGFEGVLLCVHVDPNPDAAGHYHPAVVIADLPETHPLGWDWGDEWEQAQQHAERLNRRMDLSGRQVEQIVLSSAAARARQEAISEDTEPKAEPRFCLWVPDTRAADGHFYPSIIKEDEPGHQPTDWDWGEDREIALQACRERNAGMGLSEQDVKAIVESSIIANSVYGSFLDQGASESVARRRTIAHMADMRRKYPKLRKA